MSSPVANPVEEVQRINRTWLVRGRLAEDTAAFLASLGQRDPDLLAAACQRALTAARQASKEQRDPKPDFYAALFLHATPEETSTYLQDHPWTRRAIEQ